MSSAERRLVAEILRRLREAPGNAEAAIKANPSVGEPSPYPFLHGWLVGTVRTAADDLERMLLAEENT